ncbi:hypothetical protein FNF27_02565 [Cafeteria roenbergensis]|uniref:TLC domain-containing protein n=1 Tax=Cafeteria roenbergensis TaxID=33653 RepID=A0A5A8EF24_CAFRO|nr:hypothetical protein FNF27_02565 [Cafeteria roenbergensis]
MGGLARLPSRLPPLPLREQGQYLAMDQPTGAAGQRTSSPIVRSTADPRSSAMAVNVARRVKPLESLRRTAAHTIHSANDRITGETTATPAVMDGKPAGKKQGIVVFIGEVLFVALRPLVACFPPPREPGSTADLHDMMNMALFLIMGPLCIYSIFTGVMEVWPSLLGVAYFSLDMLWLVWDPSIVKQPGEIMMHHVVGLTTSACCIFVPIQWSAPLYGLTVEAHSFFIILQRRLGNTTSGFVAKTLMLITWIPMRLVASMYPTWIVHQQILDGKFSLPMGIVASVESIALVAMQIVWTIVIYQNRHKWFGTAKPGKAVKKA